MKISLILILTIYLSLVWGNAQVIDCAMFKVDTIEGEFLLENHFYFNKSLIKDNNGEIRESLIEYKPKESLLNLYYNGIYIKGLSVKKKYYQNLLKCNPNILHQIKSNWLDEDLNMAYGYGHFLKKFAAVKTKKISYKTNFGRIRYKLIKIKIERLYMGTFPVSVFNKMREEPINIPVYYVISFL